MVVEDGATPAWITTAEAAQRLGVKAQTVYAYVSRGLLVSRRDPAGRGSLLDPIQVDRLGASGARGRDTRERVHRFRSVASAVSHTSGDTLYYRGRDACLWAPDVSLEEAAAHVLGEGPRAVPAPPGVPVAHLAAVPLGRRPTAVVTRAAERGWGVSADPREVPALVLGLMPTLVDALAAPGEAAPCGSPTPGETGAPEGWAARVVAHLTGRTPTGPEVRAVEVLLVLLLDHGLTASTTATRAAASARAGLADCLLAGYAALAGRLHGTAPLAVHAAIAAEIERGASAGPRRPDAPRAVGFGHALYRDGDPRAQVALAVLADVPAAAPALAAVDRLRATLPPGGAHDPTVDVALAVTCLALDADPAAGPALFALARTVGLAAHAAEEWGEEALRWRGRAATRASGAPSW